MSNFEVLDRHDLNIDEVVTLDIMALNTLLMDMLIPKRDVKEIKSLRRRIKMRKYRNDSSRKQKGEIKELVVQRDRLADEAAGLEAEIEDLRHKIAMVELLDMLETGENH